MSGKIYSRKRSSTYYFGIYSVGRGARSREGICPPGLFRNIKEDRNFMPTQNLDASGTSGKSVGIVDAMRSLTFMYVLNCGQSTCVSTSISHDHFISPDGKRPLVKLDVAI